MDQKSGLSGEMTIVIRLRFGSLEELSQIRDYLARMPMDGVQIEHQPIPEMPERKPPASPAQEKQAILEKLAAYRKRHGLGAYGTLAQKYGRGGKDFAAETLRSLAESSITLPIEDWRRIGRALDKAVADE